MWKHGGFMRGRRVWKIAFVSAVCLTVASTVHTQSAQGVWSEKALLPDIRSEATTVFASGRLYVMGGLARGLESSTLTQEYDPATDAWRERAPMPGPLSHPNGVALNGKIYVVGGFLAQVHVGAQNAAFEYDPSADTWRRLAPLQVARGSSRGRGAERQNPRHWRPHGGPCDVGRAEVYDPATDTWNDAAPLPRARDHAAVAAVNGRIHVIGGRFKHAGRQHRHARHLRPRHECLDSGAAAAHTAQRRRVGVLQGPHRRRRR